MRAWEAASRREGATKPHNISQRGATTVRVATIAQGLQGIIRTVGSSDVHGLFVPRYGRSG